MINRRLFISVPNDKVLTQSQREIKWTIIAEIEQIGFIAEIFYNTRPNPKSIAVEKGWSFSECMNLMRRCVGVIIIGFPRHILASGGKLSTEYAHLEGAIATCQDLPIFLLAEKALEYRGIFNSGKHKIISIPINATKNWLSAKFKVELKIFIQTLEFRKDIFLAYCSTSTETAIKIKNFLTKTAGVTVLDWQNDFNTGHTIIEEIENACKRTTGGIFLFTKDDKLDGVNELAAPRDNVIFETGFFAHAKGRERILIIREMGAKMPADLGGSIYVTLKKKGNIEPIKTGLLKFIEVAI